MRTPDAPLGLTPLMTDLAAGGRHAAGTAATAAAAAAVRWSSRELLAGMREVEIEHEGMVYRLRLTTLGKLILTK